MHNVSLSYASEDRARAKAVAAAFENAGLSVWWDRRLAAGTEYSKEIEHRLRSADAVVVLWSKQSTDSPWVRDEAAKGRDSGRLVPASLDGAEPPLGFGQFHTIDLSSRSWKQGPLSELVEATAERIRGKGASANADTPPLAGKPQPRTLRPIWIGGSLAAAAAAAAIYLFDVPQLISPGTDEPAGGKVAIAGFQSVSNDPQSRRIAQLAEGAVERTLSTNFIETVASRAASARSLAGADFSLEGTVDRADEQVTILASIVDPDSGRTLWSTEVSRPPGESRELAEELAILLSDVIAARPTPSARCRTDKWPDFWR